MDKKLYLTFDIETIVSRFSYNPTYHASVFLGAMYIANELKKRSLKGTFYISLSPKSKEIPFAEYIETITLLLRALKNYDNIKLEPHIHAFGLPVSFKCKNDEFSKYNKAQQQELLDWSKTFFEKEGITVENFRPGGYNVNESYYEALSESNYKTSSVLLKDEGSTINIDLTNGKIADSSPYRTKSGVVEYPVTSVKVKSIKPGKTEIVNLSPDFFRIESVQNQMEKLSYVNVNFHSFSMFNNRLARENHKGQMANNLGFLFFEKWINRVLRKRKIETINHNTLFREEFIKWMDYFHKREYKTYFIGE